MPNRSVPTSSPAGTSEHVLMRDQAMQGIETDPTIHDPSIPSHRLLRGVDHSKDQSYVLFGVPRRQLSHMMLPIGGMEKPRVRELAREFGLPVFDKPDSQEICFVPDNDYAGLVERRSPGAVKAGPIVDREGRTIGEHGGQHRFTIGQRRGLDISLGQRVYVTGKNAATNTVIAGLKEDLLRALLARWGKRTGWWMCPPESCTAGQSTVTTRRPAAPRCACWITAKHRPPRGVLVASKRPLTSRRRQSRLARQSCCTAQRNRTMSWAEAGSPAQAADLSGPARP